MNRNRPGNRVVPLEEPRAAVAGDCHGVSEPHSDCLPHGLPCCEFLEDRNWGGLIHCCVFNTKKVPGPGSVSPVVNYGLGPRKQPQRGTFVLELDGGKARAFAGSAPPTTLLLQEPSSPSKVASSLHLTPTCILGVHFPISH